MKVKKIYCDACGRDITDLHSIRAKSIVYHYKYSHFYQRCFKHKTRQKLYLCNCCYRGLTRIAERNINEVTENE